MLKMNRPDAEQSALSLEKRFETTLTAALKAIHSATSPDSTTPEDLERQRKGQELLGRMVTPMLGMRWEPFEIGGMPAAWVRPEQGENPRKIVLYCHGGGYTTGNLGYARPLAAKLAQGTGCPVLAFEYRLAPEHPYPAALKDAEKAWNYLMHQGYGAADVVLAGDSAGGNMALELVMRLRAEGRKLPGQLVLFSPWTDMTATSESYDSRGETDPMLTKNYICAVRQAYAPGADWSRWEYSPLYGDFTAFPPTLIQVGDNEILLEDSLGLRRAMQEQGVLCRLEQWPGMWHVFQMFPIKKAAEAMESACRFIREGK